jgi:hypothetical protein
VGADYVDRNVARNKAREIVLPGRPSAAPDVVGRYSDQGEPDKGEEDRFVDESERQLATLI